jgi:hypothetical protein
MYLKKPAALLTGVYKCCRHQHLARGSVDVVLLDVSCVAHAAKGLLWRVVTCSVERIEAALAETHLNVVAFARDYIKELRVAAGGGARVVGVVDGAVTKHTAPLARTAIRKLVKKGGAALDKPSAKSSRAFLEKLPLPLWWRVWLSNAIGSECDEVHNSKASADVDAVHLMRRYQAKGQRVAVAS